ncbi:indolepyruvate ferredoxin oxidoreductase subunit alpha [Rossellomorea vietnamensis]|uniref:indolepyruvate ferredoxin oxidoreductase subunit alpha n=1 Tax=Rossellomorea vietnamensis TaxID=218284 RepID=UPI003CFB6104
MAFVITSPCMHEQAADCVDVCPVDCIEKGPDQFFIDPSRCIECGMCEAVCPIGAVYQDFEVPEEEQVSISRAKEFFFAS